MSLIGQMDLTSTPPPIDAVQPWWPLIVACLSGLGFVCSSLWAAYTAMRNARSQSAADQARIEFETRKDFVDDLMAETKELREECKTQRTEYAKLSVDYATMMTSTMARDQESKAAAMENQTTISDQRKEIELLKSRILELEAHIQRLTKHVEALEQKNDARTRHN